MVTDLEWFIAFTTIIPMVIFWFIIFMLWISECMRVAVKTSGSYDDYINDNADIVIIKQGKNNVSVYDKKGQKIEQKNKEEDLSVKPKNISQVSITYV